MLKEYYRIYLCIGLLLLSGLVSAGQAYLEKEGVRMPIKDTLITYDKRLAKLTIYFFPSRLSAQDKQALAGSESAFSVLWNKPSPDTKKWQWYPYAKLQLTGKNGKTDDLADIANYYLMAYGISEKNFTDNVNGFFAADDKPALFKKRGKRVELEYQGMSDYSKLRWDLNIRAQVRN